MSFLDEQLPEMWSELDSGELSPSTRLRVLNLWVWMSKALLMRGHLSGMDTAFKVGRNYCTEAKLEYLQTISVVAADFVC